MDIENYIKNKHQNNKLVEYKKIKYLKNLITRILISIIIIISVCIYLKYDDTNVLKIEKYFFEESLKFTKINNLYGKYMGQIIPAAKNNTELVFSSSELKNNKYEDYKNGVKITSSKNQPISSLIGGIVVYIGKKEGYDNTIIIQGNDGMDYWYGGVQNISINLYDYIEKDTIIAETKENYLYLVLQKNGVYINYEEIL